MRSLVACLLLTIPLAACAGPATFDVRTAGEASTIELALARGGQISSIEYHVDPADVPTAVKQAMDRLHPGDRYSDAEIEVTDGQVLYELSRMVDGRKVEALFEASGRLVSEEIEVEAETIPDPVRDAAKTRFPRGTAWTFEEIRNSQQRLVEYHIKVQQDGMRYKIAAYQNGHLHTIWREVEAEVEVPLS